MQSEQDWLDESNQSSVAEAYRYFMRPDPDMRDFLGPIETSFDPLTNREMRHRKAEVAMMRGSDALKETIVYLDPYPHVRITKAKDLQGWYSSKNDGANPGQRDRPCETDAILTQPYGGFCHVGCQFCYINSGNKGYRGSGLITVPIGYGAHVEKQLRSMHVSAAGYFSSFTDPFLPLENYYHNTYNGAKAFTDVGLPIFFLSRLSYPGWAYDLLKKNKYSYAQKSINTPDPETWHKLSPGALPLEDHLSEITELSKQGIYVSIQCNPIIPGVVNHDDVERLFERLAEAGANHVIIKFVEANFPWAAAMYERIARKFPGLPSDRFKELFTENGGGGQRTIVETYRREGHARYSAKAKSLGLTYATCYEYTRDATGRFRSIGPEYLSADQCHGHMVPMHRRTPNGFEAMAECPPSGCLRCSNEGEPSLCDSDILTSAKALRLPDLRRPWNPKAIPMKEV